MLLSIDSPRLPSHVAPDGRNVTGYRARMDEELTAAQIADLRRALEALQVELTASLESASEGAKIVDLDQPIGRVSRIDAIQQQKMAEASKAKQQLRLGQVRQALSAVESGDYGLCRSCDEPIAFRRLRARPESPLCLRCQGGRERR